MHSFMLPLLFATGQAAGGKQGGTMDTIIGFLPFILIIAIFYFLIIRPQNKKQKETRKMLEALKKGDKVVTIGGVHGTIARVNDKTVLLKVDDNVKLEFSRSAISSVEEVSQAEAQDVTKKDVNTAKEA
jgi:preprotein translocase subunit YajC